MNPITCRLRINLCRSSLFLLVFLLTVFVWLWSPWQAEAKTQKGRTASELENPANWEDGKAPGPKKSSNFKLPTPEPTPWRRTQQDEKKDKFYERYFRKGKQIKKEDDLATSDEEKAMLLKKLMPIHTPTPEGNKRAKEIRKLIHDLGTEHHRRQAAIERLVMIGEPAVPALRKTLKHTFKFKRVGALQALGYIRSQKAILDIQRLLGDQESVVRLEAIKVLGKMKHKASIPKIMDRLHDKDKRVQREVLVALGRIQSEGSKQGLLKALNHVDPEIRLLTCDELSFFDGEKVVVALLSTTRDEVRDVRVAAIRALGEIGDPMARPQLRVLAKSEDHLLRQEALQALNNIQ
jgi:HEAT repeat protein